MNLFKWPRFSLSEADPAPMADHPMAMMVGCYDVWVWLPERAPRAAAEPPPSAPDRLDS